MSSDEELVARAVAARDQAAFGELVRRHQSRVRNWLRQLTRNAATADDIAQEAFIKAWDKLDSFGGQGRFAAWLMKIAYTEFLMSHRKSKGEQRLAAAVEAATAEAPVHDPSGEQAVAADLERLLAILTGDERAVMVLCYAQGLSHGEASEVTGIPVGTVKSHISRGKDKIRQRFFPEEVRHA
ncbi:MAG: RNA polymerase sigma factor [Chromatiales bacterium]|jgi:RNA polymerase sigma-70 factor (ECF subfamily)|nr:MAG: RNA polymerase sigma factor [Chromatiales bacterium]